MKATVLHNALVLAFAVLSTPRLCGAESCDPIRTFADGKQPLREIFISPTGSDETGDGSRSRPYQTLSHVTRMARPGDAIRLLPATYAGGLSLRNLAGTSNAPIWVGGIPGEPRPQLLGGATAVHLSRVQFLVLEEIEVSRSTGNGINCDDGGDYANSQATRHVLFRNLAIRDIGKGGNQDALKLSGVNDFVVVDCEFARSSAGGSGIDHVGCHRGLIARCTFADMGSNAIQCKGGSEDIEIRWNRFEDGGGRAINIGGSTGFQFFRPPLSTNRVNAEARNIRVVANLFRGSDAPIAFVGAVDCLAANNTLIEPRRWIVRILQETISTNGYSFEPSGRNRFVNNLVYFERGQISSDLNIGPHTDPASFQFANNLWYAFDKPAQSAPELAVAETNGLYGMDPLLKDPKTGDGSIQRNSPAVGRGHPLTVIRADLAEHCYAAPPSIGAVEGKITERD